jgi:acetylornithine/succinyldiaminopimelate/putrescine aminotransferase
MLPTVLVQTELDRFLTTYKGNVAAEARAILIANYVNTPEFTESFNKLQKMLLDDREKAMKFGKDAPKPAAKPTKTKGANGP